jgi:CDP-diacylglycerol---glycerol-3-phosphate 3-phosphatidyltransferase
MNLPNRLTLMRLFLIPLLIFFALFPFAHFGINFGYTKIRFVSIPNLNIIMLIIFVVASATDYLDGYIARKYKLITTFGKFFDPIADKLLVNTLFIILASFGQIPVIAVILMIARDTLVDAIRMLNAKEGLVVSAQFLGKAKTVSQMITIVLYLVGNLPFELVNLPVHELMLWFTVSVSLLSGISYFMQSRKLILASM